MYEEEHHKTYLGWRGRAGVLHRVVEAQRVQLHAGEDEGQWPHAVPTDQEGEEEQRVERKETVPGGGREGERDGWSRGWWLVVVSVVGVLVCSANGRRSSGVIG